MTTTEDPVAGRASARQLRDLAKVFKCEFTAEPPNCTADLIRQRIVSDKAGGSVLAAWRAGYLREVAELDDRVAYHTSELEDDGSRQAIFVPCLGNLFHDVVRLLSRAYPETIQPCPYLDEAIRQPHIASAFREDERRERWQRWSATCLMLADMIDPPAGTAPVYKSASWYDSGSSVHADDLRATIQRATLAEQARLHGLPAEKVNGRNHYLDSEVRRRYPDHFG